MSETPTNQDIRQLTVELGERSYPIWIGENADPQLAAAISSRRGKGAYLADAKLGDFFPNLAAHQNVLMLPYRPNGETAKAMSALGEIYEHLANNGIARDGFLIAVGGGVTGDLGGFAAASYLRGIDFYQVPTTLLAMVDSSVGGKTGINITAGKNLVGAFWQPKAVYISTDYLATLPPWEFSAGMGEVIKYGMLYDRALFDQLHTLDKPLAWDHPTLPDVIYRCCQIKAEIVKADEKETAASGGRALLNLGHTFAHAIENVAGYGTYLHGEAVAVGLALATRLSEELPGCMVSTADLVRVKDLLAKYHLPVDLRSPLQRKSRADDYVWLKSINPDEPATEVDCPPDAEPPQLKVDALLNAMKRDKKVKGGKLCFVVMNHLGEAVTVDDVDEELVRGLWVEAGAVE